MRVRRPTAVDLFCGCGGLTVGLKRAGFRVVGAVDVDPLSVKTYKANHRNVIIYEKDIRELDPQELLDAFEFNKGDLGLLAGGPPCQGFSTLRTLNGARVVDDPRNDLLLDFVRFVDALRPRAVMMENVPGLVGDQRLVAFVQRLNALGYLGAYRVLNAADYGVPQRRRRLIYLAGMGMEIPFPETSSRMRTVRDAIGGLPRAGQSGDPLHDMPEKRSQRVMRIIQISPKWGGGRMGIPMEYQPEYLRRCTGFRDVYCRMVWGDVAPTITSGCYNPSKGRFLHPEENRAITMREAALLQGFPRQYRFPVIRSKSAITSMIGNAFPPPFAAALARSIRRALGGGAR